MKLIGLMPVRNEAWCLGLTARVALKWCDELVMLDHRSIDTSPEIMRQIAREYPGRVHLMANADQEWNEMDHRQSMLAMARAEGAGRIAIIDADEFLTANLADPDWAEARAFQRSVKSFYAGQIMEMPGFNLRHGIDEYHASGTWAHRSFSLVFVDDPRLHWTGDRFHNRAPMGNPPLRPWRPFSGTNCGIVHLWGANERRLRAKHAWYKVTERLRWPLKPVGEIDRQYSVAIRGTEGLDTPADWRFRRVSENWMHPELMKFLDLDAVPWQEKAIEDAVAQHGRGTFAGLDLFGY